MPILWGYAFLLLRGGQGQVLKGSSPSILRQMERCQGCITATWPGAPSHICSRGCPAVSPSQSCSISQPARSDTFCSHFSNSSSRLWRFTAAETHGQKMRVIKACGRRNEVLWGSPAAYVSTIIRGCYTGKQRQMLQIGPRPEYFPPLKIYFLPPGALSPSPLFILYFSDLFPTCDQTKQLWLQDHCTAPSIRQTCYTKTDFY